MKTTIGLPFLASSLSLCSPLRPGDNHALTQLKTDLKCHRNGDEITQNHSDVRKRTKYHEEMSKIYT